MSTITAPAGRSAGRRAGTVVLWVVAFLVTVGLGAYQRLTGPTHPLRVSGEVGGARVGGKLLRSHPGAGGPVVTLSAPDPAVTGEVVWRRYPTAEPWTKVAMTRDGETLKAELPHFPPAAKIEYDVRLAKGERALVVPKAEAVVLRYRGDVPAYVLVPHILMMFVGLMIGMYCVLLVPLAGRDPVAMLPRILLFMVPGGLVLGPIVQKFSFGAYWTGWPFGEDLTDNKTLGMIVAWAVAWWIGRRNPRAGRVAILAAAAIMLAVYLVPHSARGSQLDWKDVDRGVPVGAETH